MVHGNRQKIINALQEVADAFEISKDQQLFGPQIEDRGEQITFSALGQDAPLALKSVWDPDQTKRHAMQKELEKIIPEFGIRVGGTTSIDITRKLISKETGVLWLSNRFGIPPEEMLYVGDALYPGGNDTAVMTTHIQLQQVTGPTETKEIIKELLDKKED